MIISITIIIIIIIMIMIMMIIIIFIYEIIYIYIWLYIRLSPAEPNVRPWLHNISQFSHDYTTCFIRVSNRLAGMDGTLGVAPRYADDTKFASWLVSVSR